MGLLGLGGLAGVLCFAAQFVNNTDGVVFQGGEGPAEVRRSMAATACLDCHQFPDRLSHPIGVVVRRPVELPLGEGGTVVCATCHDPGQHKSGGIQRAALRLRAPDLCRECHAESRQMNRIEHGIALGRAHFTSEGVRLSARGIDAVTRECVGCHDGSVAAERVAEVRINLRGSHPVGTTYDLSSRAGRKGHLRPKQELPAEVQLVQGTVGCQSCHSPYSRDEAMVTQPMQDSQLCRSCHDM